MNRSDATVRSAAGRVNGRAFGSVLESLVIAVILLVLVQTFLEDFAVLSGWNVDIRSKLLLAGFFFDLFFTIEFLIRLYNALMEGRVGRYLTQERGWIDFLASIPLLMFNSGPFALTLLTGQGVALGLGGVLNLLKVIKAIRIARILRFLRIVKIFRRIKNVSSPMAQRHVASITAISVTVLVLCLLFFTLFSSSTQLRGLDTAISDQQEAIADHLEQKTDDPAAFVQALETLQNTQTNLLIVKYRGQTVYSRYSDETYANTFAPGDYTYLPEEELELFFDQRPYVSQLARESVLFFIIVVLIVLAYLLIYSPHFAITVSDPIHVMRRGLEETDYNLEVKIPERYENDDVFELAELYNEKYLPLKDRTQNQQESLLKLDLEEVSHLVPEEEEES
ncbi:MAG: ion transporter [Spirochaetaceae bacterium]|nr:MAG: ion transporter [Spirochaetaceae bacterium]